MSQGKVGVDYVQMFAIENAGVAVPGVPLPAIIVRARNLDTGVDDASMPAAIEIGNGRYSLAIRGAFSLAQGPGRYGWSAEVASALPLVDNFTAGVVEFTVADLDNVAEAAQYDSPIGPAVWVDTFFGSAGAVVGTNGTSSNPVNNEADAFTLATALGYRQYYFRTGSSFTLASGSAIAYQDWCFGGKATIDIGGKNVWGSRFFDVGITGTFDNTGNVGFDIVAKNCNVQSSVGLSGRLVDCILTGTIATATSGPANTLVVTNCRQGTVPGQTRLALGDTNRTRLILHDYIGELEFTDMGVADTSIEASFNGAELIFAASCTLGIDPKLRGHFTVVNNGSINLDLSAQIDPVALAKGMDRLGVTGKIVEHKKAIVGTNGHIKVPADGSEQNIIVKKLTNDVTRLNEP